MTERAFPSRPELLILLGGLAAMSAFAIDIILPSTGLIANSFGVQESRGAILIGTYFVGFGLGQLIRGLLSDAFGRKPVLIVGLSGFVLASIACVFAPSFTLLIVSRFSQGFTGGSPVVARAIVRDLGSGEAAARMMTVLFAMVFLAPLVAPALGSGLLILFSWHAAFVVLALSAAVMLVMVIVLLPETLKTPMRERLRPSFILHAVPFLFSKRDFLAGLCVTSFTFGGFAAVLSLGAVVAEKTYGIAPTAFGSVFAVAAVFMVIGIFSVRRLLTRFGLRRSGPITLGVLALAALVHLAFLFFEPDFTVFWGGVCLYMMATGMILPTGSALALEPAGEMPGFASSLLGSIQMMVGAVGAGICAALFDGSHRAISITMLVFGVLASCHRFWCEPTGAKRGKVNDGTQVYPAGC